MSDQLAVDLLSPICEWISAPSRGTSRYSPPGADRWPGHFACWLTPAPRPHPATPAAAHRPPATYRYSRRSARRRTGTIAIIAYQLLERLAQAFSVAAGVAPAVISGSPARPGSSRSPPASQSLRLMALQQSVGHAVDGGDIGVFLLQFAQRLPMAAAEHHR